MVILITRIILAVCVIIFLIDVLTVLNTILCVIRTRGQLKRLVQRDLLEELEERL